MCSKGHGFSSCASVAAPRAGQRDIAELGSIAQEGTSHGHRAKAPANPAPEFMGSVKKLMGGETGPSQVRGWEITLQMISCPSGGKWEHVSPLPEGSSCKHSLKGRRLAGIQSFLWHGCQLARHGLGSALSVWAAATPLNCSNFPLLGTCSISNVGISPET